MIARKLGLTTSELSERDKRLYVRRKMNETENWIEKKIYHFSNLASMLVVVVYCADRVTVEYFLVTGTGQVL